MRRAVFGEPLRAHPAEIGPVNAPGNTRLLDQQRATDGDENGDGVEQHGDAAGSSPRDWFDRPRSGRSRLCCYAHLPVPRRPHDSGSLGASLVG